MEQQNPIKKNYDKDLSKSTSSILDKLQIRGGRFEKRLFVFLIMIVVIAIPLTIWQFSSNLTDPFLVDNTDNSSLENSSTDQLTQTNSSSNIPILDNLRDRDTDKDGLSDYDELYNYKTSPYIQDSDSDSILDNIEVEQGTDPNCPTGNTCSRQESSGNDTNNNTSTIITNSKNNLENLSIDQLRQIMIDAGAPEQDVYQIPEEDLLATYRQILEEENLSPGTGNTNDPLNLNLDGSEDTSSIYSNLDYDKLFNLNPTEIRQLLIEGGVPESDLSEVDDETLKEIYLESLSQNFSQANQ